MSESGYLTNQLLIAMPAMGDPNFAQTVALICDHGPRGALGLILNKPLPMRMAEIFEQLEIEIAAGPLARAPRAARRPHADRPRLRGASRRRRVGLDAEGLRCPACHHLARHSGGHGARRGPDEAVVALGYAGWDGGQLEEEIRANAWLSAPVDLALIFDLPFESRWQAAGRLLGVELSRISPISGNA